MIQTSSRRFLLKILFVFLAAAGALAFSSGTSWNAFGFQTETASSLKSAIDQAIIQSAEFLILQQEEDGAWHSKHYGSMKQGAANTALVLYALSHLPADQQPDADVYQRAMKFLLPAIKEQGCVANPDGSLDYPVYSTALILTAHKRVDLKLTSAQIRSMVKFLVDSQCTKSRGFTQQNPNHGGWDILGPEAQGKTTGANASVTFYVVEALSDFRPAESTKPSDRAGSENPENRISKELEKEVQSALVAASQWCQRIQSSDGGFHFTTKSKSGLNKAGWSDKEQTQPNAYGSATCDGLSLLLQLGKKPASGASPNQPKTRTGESVRKSINWLVAHPGVDNVPGFKTDVDLIGWPLSLKFYYAAALSRSLNEFEKEQAASTGAAIAKQLIDNQLKSGAWRNESSQMREDDELIATPFGLIALLNCKSSGIVDVDNN